MIASFVVAHPDRLHQAEELAAQVGATIVLDTEGLGAGGNHRRALTLGVESKASHILVLEDDALPIPSFTSTVAEAVEQRPDQILGLYVGKARPAPQAVQFAVGYAEKIGASWLTHPGLLWGVGTVWPAEFAAHFLAWPELQTEPGYGWETHGVTLWCLRNGHKVAYCYPSLVDHADTPSVIRGRDEGRELGRVAHRVGRPRWNNLMVGIAHEQGSGEC